MIIEKLLHNARSAWFRKNNVIESAIKWITQLLLLPVMKLLLTTGHIVADIFFSFSLSLSASFFLWMWLESNHSPRSNEANARHYYYHYNWQTKVTSPVVNDLLANGELWTARISRFSLTSSCTLFLSVFFCLFFLLRALIHLSSLHCAFEY